MIAFLDTETGGLNPHTDALLEVGFLVPENPKLSFSAVINPCPTLQITDRSKLVNGWPKAYEGRERLEESTVLLLLHRRIAESGVKLLVCHNAPFDISFLKAAAQRSRPAFEREPDSPTFTLPRTLCTMAMGHALNLMGAFSEDRPCPSLDFLLAELCPGFQRPKTHNALDDARSTEAVYNSMKFALQSAGAMVSTFNYQTVPTEHTNNQNHNEKTQKPTPSKTNILKRGWARFGQ